MTVSFLFDYPSWLIIVCLAVGLLYSMILYYKNLRDGLNLVSRWVLSIFRFVVISLIGFLLLGPLIEKQNQYIEEPIIAIFQDNSSSVLLFEDSLWYRTEYLAEMHDFIESLSSDFLTRHYSFGESVRIDPDIDFAERETNMAMIFTELEARYSNRNLAAVIVAGDGIYNRGINPLFASAAIQVPVFAVAMGDTIPRRDLILSNIRHNRITYLGNRFPVEIDIRAIQSRGLSSKLIVRKDEEVLFEQDIQFAAERHHETISLNLEADEPGMQRYRAELLPIEGEVSLRNNYQEFFVDVIDRRRQVLILANAPHPDVGAIKLSLEQGGQYDINVSTLSDFDGNPEAYDVIVLHQLPAANELSVKTVEHVLEANAGVLFIIGSQTDIDLLNQMGRGIGIERRTTDFTEAFPEHNQGFALFSLREDIIRTISQMPPLYVPFASYTMPSASSVLLYQRIGQVVTNYPLIGFSAEADTRTGLIAGEGLWRWRLQSYHRHGSHDAFDELMSRLVQYLSIQEDRSLFRIRTRPLIMENEPLIIEAELYNRSYELVNDPEVSLTITTADGAVFPFMMGKTSTAYRLDAGSFQPGTYTYLAEVVLGGETFSEEGVVNVSALDLEGLTTVADHRLLYQLAYGTGGEMFYPDQWDDLRSELLLREDFRPRVYARKNFVELINMRWLFLLMLCLLSAEWLIRKRTGGY